jgi:hypothetical protein
MIGAAMGPQIRRKPCNGGPAATTGETVYIVIRKLHAARVQSNSIGSGQACARMMIITMLHGQSINLVQ